MTDLDRGKLTAISYIVLMMLADDDRGKSILESIRTHIDPRVKENKPPDTYAGFDSMMKAFETVVKDT